ncbi:unnamed protein product [Diatraea saccharalis]|uniref:Uncharacterized protein n=1 Tax=Diatraea saccharalis TaxID=40085 RepID=A0A9N9WGS2_9NEOP|nr:unnamed protein product [Diatraea saccharalis]
MVVFKTLAFRRIMALILQSLSIFNQKIDGHMVLESLNLFVPTRMTSDSSGLVAPFRRLQLLARPVTRTRSAARAPNVRAFSLLGDILVQHEDLDLFTDNLTCLCNKIHVYVIISQYDIII